VTLADFPEEGRAEIASNFTGSTGPTNPTFAPSDYGFEKVTLMHQQ
jgi:hypothetical protein